jgi:SAM-dependent methyltransferase
LEKNNSRKILWKKIWNNRKISFKKKNSDLRKLMILNGHLKIKLNSWKKYGNNIIDKLNFKKKDSIFEFGCGSGALLYLFKTKTNKLYGCDFSNQLITASKKIFPNLKIFHTEIEKFYSCVKYDHVISSSVLEYAESRKIKRIIITMINTFKKKLFIGEILDKKFQEEFLKKNKKPENYYSFIEKKTFIKICNNKKLKLKILPSMLPGSNQKKYRYCVLISK